MLGELNQDQIEQVLRSEVVGRIGCHADGRTYVVPVAYTYDGKSIYGHSREGLKVRLMRANPGVCFEVEHVDDLANWRSVIAWGTFEELQGDDAVRAMRALVDRLLPLVASETSQPAHAVSSTSGRRIETGDGPVVVYRIDLTEKTGRFEKR